MCKSAKYKLLAVLMCAAVNLAADFQQATAPRAWNFPRDHGRHDGYKLEWWYFTGNVQDSAGRHFGYQLTFFRSALEPTATSRPSGWAMSSIYFAHAAVSDIAGNTFVFKDRLERSRLGLAFSSDQTMDVSLLDWSAKLDGDKISLKASETNFEIDLQLTGGRDPVLQGPGGVNIKGHEVGQSSYYYSMTRLKSVGTLTVNGHLFRVEGQSWMDHEFSSDALAENQVGWDWMGLQLTDGTDLMVYRMRDANGSSDYLSGTRTTADGKPHYLSDRELKIAGDHPWKSPTSGASYPQQWTVTLVGRPPLTVTSEMPGQELITTASTKVTYFEGAVTVHNQEGLPVGQGYLEMTGYAR